jgi:hypothetical protein
MRLPPATGVYLLAWAFLALGCSGPPGAAEAQEGAPDTADVRAAASVITEEGIRDKVFLLAHDSMRGRWTPSPELEQAARWAQARFRELGLRPGGDGGSHLQWYPLPEGATGPGARGGDATRAPNVVAILPGRDRNLRREYVVFSAHMDHVGIGRPDARGDSIYNGADDNASGTAAVMAIAAAFAALPEAPRRSVAFVLVSGEERGLWGSRHFVDRGRIPTELMVANLNLDMIGRNGPDTIVAVGKEHSDLGPMVRDVALRHPELGLVVIPDPWPRERFFFRSDQYSFARRGVPSLFLFSGTHEDYHRPGDLPDRVDADKAARVARLAFLAGLEIAEGTERPRWNPESHDRIVETLR